MGIRIRQLREKKEFSQEYLANICDIPKNQIGRIERAEINTTIKTIVKIANALEIEPKELFNFKS
ncbi:helix-turn-helix domain-containing protein [Flavobacterium cheonhonense]|nr:helix-turn-helix transcriptional regulator [Flavobacterium cheonhonense]